MITWLLHVKRENFFSKCPVSKRTQRTKSVRFHFAYGSDGRSFFVEYSIDIPPKLHNCGATTVLHNGTSHELYLQNCFNEIPVCQCHSLTIRNHRYSMKE